MSAVSLFLALGLHRALHPFVDGGRDPRAPLELGRVVRQVLPRTAPHLVLSLAVFLWTFRRKWKGYTIFLAATALLIFAIIGLYPEFAELRGKAIAEALGGDMEIALVKNDERAEDYTLTWSKYGGADGYVNDRSHLHRLSQRDWYWPNRCEIDCNLDPNGCRSYRWHGSIYRGVCCCRL